MAVDLGQTGPVKALGQAEIVTAPAKHKILESFSSSPAGFALPPRS